MDHSMQDEQYAFYSTNDQAYYNPFQQRIDPYHNLQIIPQSHHYQQQQPFPHVPHHANHTPPPPSPELYDPPVPPAVVPAPDPALYSPSPSSPRPHSLVHRSQRYNPSPSPTSSSGTSRRRASHSQDSDDDDFALNSAMGSTTVVESLAHSRKEATRRQRIEAEQRRRDELRDGYAKLKDALPVSNQKSSKVSLLERAVNHIAALEKENQELQARIVFLEQESHRLRSLNEKISLHSDSLNSEGTASPEPAQSSRNTTTPDALISVIPTHSLASVRGQLPPSEHSSPSASEHGH